MESFISKQKEIILPYGKYEEYLPSPFLIGYIKRYYFTEGFDHYAGMDIKAMAKENVEIAFHYENSVIDAYNFRTKEFEYFKGCVTGVHPLQKTTWNRFLREIKMFTAELTHMGLISLLSVTSFDVFDSSLELETILGCGGKILVDNIANANSNLERIEILESFFRNRLRKNVKPGNKDQMLFRFQEAYPFVCVKDICKLLNINRRTIERLYMKNIGLSPKEYLKIIRFNKACELLAKYPGMRSCDIAYECNYSDQSHFIREFKMLFKSSPLKFTKKSDNFLYLGRGYFVEKKLL